MRYLFSQGGIYYFRRRIPNSGRNYTFSLKTKNVKIARKIRSLFLLKAERVFWLLRDEKREVVLQNIKEITFLLDEYQERALLEYSDEETARHRDFSCVDETGRAFDGGHPLCMKKWIQILQDEIYSPEIDEELFQRIFQRTGIDPAFLKKLSKREKEIVKTLTLKNEAFIIKEDYQRTKARFDLDYEKPIKPSIEVQVSNTEEKERNKYYDKTARQIFQDFLRKKELDTKEMHKYEEPIEILLKVVRKEYLIDYTAEDMSDFVFVIKHMPKKTSKRNRELYVQYPDYMELARYVKENIPKEKITLKTALEKIRRATVFLDYAVEMEKLDKNRLKIKTILPSTIERQKFERAEKKQRVDFSDEELNRLFHESLWYNEKGIVKSLQKEQDKFFIPLIGLLQGMRLNEIAQLYLDDLDKVDGIPVFKIRDAKEDQQLKNNTAHRTIPIHPLLLDLRILEYAQMLKRQNEKRLFPQLFHTRNKGYGQAFSKKFMRDSFKKSWIDEEKLNNPKIMVDFHSFRHSFASRMSNVANSNLISELLGHSSGTITRKVYTHTSISDLYKTLIKLDLGGVDFTYLVKISKKYLN